MPINLNLNLYNNVGCSLDKPIMTDLTDLTDMTDKINKVKEKEKEKGKVHVVNLANNEPFMSSQQAIMNTIRSHTSWDVVFHDLNIDKIRDRPWFALLEKISRLPVYAGRRDGYYCAWKPFIIRDVYQTMGDNDILYYVDASRYLRTGFRANLDAFFAEVEKRGMIAGSVGDDVLNSSYDCLTNRNVWDTMGMGRMFEEGQSKRHVLSAWMAFTKTPNTTQLLAEWTHWTATDDINGLPLVVQHHTAEQAILNILLLKYPHMSKLFYHPKLRHDSNKDYNIVLEMLSRISCMGMSKIDANSLFVSVIDS